MITKKHQIIALIMVYSILIFSISVIINKLPCKFSDKELNKACIYDQSGAIGFLIFMGFFITLISFVIRKAINEIPVNRSDK